MVENHQGMDGEIRQLKRRSYPAGSLFSYVRELKLLSARLLFLEVGACSPLSGLSWPRHCYCDHRIRRLLLVSPLQEGEFSGTVEG